MKIIVASTMIPFINGGGVIIVDSLVDKLNEYGYEAQALKLPFTSNYKLMMEQMLALRLYHLEDYCDRLIPIRMPSYLLQHPQKYLWFIHHYREMYDLWDSDLMGIPKNAETRAIREYVVRADEKAFAEAKKIYTNSREVSKRLLKFNNITAEPVYPPLWHPETFYCNKYGDYIYYPSRINHHKRQLLAVQAMKYVKTDVKLVISGKTENDLVKRAIQKEIRNNSLEKKVTVIDRWITEEEKAELMANCLAAAYIPFKEDSYGYPSLEAHHSCKAVISCTDSGGTDELIVPGYNGYLTEPAPEKLAEVFDELYLDKKKAEEMGKNGGEHLFELNISWDYVIRRFTE